MGVRFSAADSTNLIDAMRNNLANTNAIIDRLRAGSLHLIAQLDAGVLQGAAYTAGRGLFAELILPGIAKLGQAVDDVETELASYEHAHSVLAEYGDLDHDDLQEALKAAEEQIRLIDELLDQNALLIAGIEALFSEELAELVTHRKALHDLKESLDDELKDTREKIAKLEWFVTDVSRYFRDSLQVMQFAAQAAIELSKVAVGADGSYSTDGVNLGPIQGLLTAKIATHGVPAKLPDKEVAFDRLEVASKLSYDKLLEWLDSDESRRLRELALQHPEELEWMLREAYRFRIDGDFGGAILVLVELMHEKGWTALAGGLTILDKFRTDGVWDMKPYLAEEYGYDGGAFHLHDSQGRIVRSDVFGNVNYGVMLAAWGVSLDVALKGANMGKKGGVDAGLGDDPLDDRAVEFGYYLYNKYPNGLTQEQYDQEIANAKLFK